MYRMFISRSLAFGKQLEISVLAELAAQNGKIRKIYKNLPVLIGSSPFYSNQNSCVVKEEPDEINDAPIQHAPSPIPNNGGYRYHIASYNIRNSTSSPVKEKEPVSPPFDAEHFMWSDKHDHCYTKLIYGKFP